MRDVNFSIDTIRIFLHILGVTVWVGGQVVMLSLLPVLRSAGVEGLPAKAANAFQRVAWPAFGLAFITGIWNIMEVDMSDTTTAYSMTFGIKFLLVIVSGVAAWIHAKSTKPSIKGMTGGLGFLASLGALILGFALTH
jgi:putative copper export protein